MEFVVLLSVLAITVTQVIARPSDTIEHSSTKDKYIGEDDIKALKYNLPTVLLHEFKITINGILDLTEENFTAAFPAKEDDENLSCRLNFNYKSNSSVEAVSAVRQSEEYSIFFNENSAEPEFILELEARKNGDGDKLEMSFNGNQSGPVLVICEIQSLENFDHIYFKGVKRINSMLFMF